MFKLWLNSKKSWKKQKIFVKKKESIFKGYGGSFRPAKIETKEYTTQTKKLVVGDLEYMLAVTADDLSTLRVFDKITLTES